MDLSIIIVNYKSAALILDCLGSLYAHEPACSFELLVVDNGDGETDKLLITQQFPSVRWISMGYNAGFARANNEGMRQSKGEVVLLLNPDTIVANDAVGKCFSKFRTSGYVACGVQLLNVDGTPQISGNYFVKGALNNLLPLAYTGDLLRWVGQKLGTKRPNVPYATSTVEVDWVNGAFLMVRRSCINEAGLLDEDFFLYAEEIEWCARLRKKGKLCLFGEINVTHLQGETANAIFGSTGKGYYNLYDKKGLQILVSNFLRIRKQFGIAWYLFHLVIYLLEIPVLLLAYTAERLTGKKSLPFRLVSGYAANMIKLLALSPKMLANRPFFYKVL